MKRCHGFCASECISGQCPQLLLQRGIWQYIGMGIKFDAEFDVPKSCKDCWYNTWKCNDCIFEGNEQCVYPNKDKKIVIEEEKGGRHED